MTQQDFPPVPEEAARPLPDLSNSEPEPAGLTAAQILAQSEPGVPTVAVPSPPASAEETPGFGPVRPRFRTGRKTSPLEVSLLRPAEFRPEDLSGMLGEVIPRMLAREGPESAAPPGATERQSEDPSNLPSPREPAASTSSVAGACKAL